MREIIFRGKNGGSGKWAYGSLIHIGDFCAILGEDNLNGWDGTYLEERSGIIYGRATLVLPETVGQFTGLLDKNGAKIFEGDIVKTRKNGTRTEKLKGYYGVDSDGYPKKIPGYEGEYEYHYNCVVECCAAVEFNPRKGYYLNGTSTFVDAICNEVIGNIHDNPELLK